MVNLNKGQKVSLAKDGKALKRILVGLGWDTAVGCDMDLDASVFLVGNTGKVTCDQDFIFYNNLKDNYGAVQHMGDNRTGAGDGDDEQIIIDLDKVPDKIERIVVVVTIDDYEKKRQNFGQVTNAYIRLVDRDTDNVEFKFDLGEDFSCETAIAFGEIYRRNGEWKFNAIGSGYDEGLYGFCVRYGVNV